MRTLAADKKKAANNNQDGHDAAELAGDPAGADGARASEKLDKALASCQGSLQAAKNSIDQASQAITTLRTSLSEMASLWNGLSELERAIKSIQWDAVASRAPASPSHAAPAPAAEETPPPKSGEAPVAPGAPDQAEPTPAASSAEAEPATSETAEAGDEQGGETDAGSPGAFSPPRRPLSKGETKSEAEAPHSFTVTVEDPGTETPLVPLYRALGRAGRIRDMDLVSYTNGVAVISLRSDDSIAIEDLRNAITEALGRDCRVVGNEDGSFVVRLQKK